MTKQEFIELHGEEAFEILVRDKLQTAELCQHGVDVLQKIHDQTIMPMLKILGFINVTGIIKTKEAIRLLDAKYEQPLHPLEILTRFANAVKKKHDVL